MISRYQRPKLKEIWSEENKYKTWAHVELAYLKAYNLRYDTAENAFKRIAKYIDLIDWHQFSKRVKEYELATRHDVIAFLRALEDELKDDARFVHIGLTSSDVVDTSFALLLRSAGEQIKRGLLECIAALFRKANEAKGVLCLGRTHGQAAEPTTFGLKLLSHAAEFARSYKRISSAIDEIGVGKFSGAIGVYGHTDPEIEKTALHYLGLIPEIISTQIVPRDRHAQFFADLAILAGSIERFCINLRLLMHDGVEEAYEPFYEGQKGSSAMPHKKNPVQSENLCGLARLMRSYALAALENQAVWHERDISHSSVERVIAPDATSLIDFSIARLTAIINDMGFDKNKMASHLLKYKDKLSSQNLMLQLVNRGMSRTMAHEAVQKAVVSGDFHALGLSGDELLQLMKLPDTIAYEDLLFTRVKTYLLDGCGVPVLG